MGHIKPREKRPTWDVITDANNFIPSSGLLIQQLEKQINHVFQIIIRWLWVHVELRQPASSFRSQQAARLFKIWLADHLRREHCRKYLLYSVSILQVECPPRNYPAGWVVGCVLTDKLPSARLYGVCRRRGGDDDRCEEARGHIFGLRQYIHRPLQVDIRMK